MQDCLPDDVHPGGAGVPIPAASLPWERPDYSQRHETGQRLRATPAAIDALSRRPQRVGWRDVAVQAPRRLHRLTTAA